ncbi:MAG TPA: hypothetical protein DEG43_00660 [Acidimicrobiaceae bacterium]|jgi:lysophospholipase L1-like esterase|nr:hypothetical protein [Acidimicrobiaceae bacterium]
MPHQDGVDGVVLSNICGMNLWPGLKPRTLLIASICVVSITACLPPAPSAGRGERVRSVVVLGDSITWGFFGVTPGIQDPLSSRLAKRGISLRLLGFPGDSIAAPWPGRTDWPTQLQRSVSEDNPDVVIIQSLLFPESADQAARADYLAKAQELIRIAQSRGAHVYLVRHQRGFGGQAEESNIAEALQQQAAEGKGVATIPADWWLDRCEDPYIPDGFHLTERGSECFSNAVNAAVNQLVNQQER